MEELGDFGKKDVFPRDLRIISIIKLNSSPIKNTYLEPQNQLFQQSTELIIKRLVLKIINIQEFDR